MDLAASVSDNKLAVTGSSGAVTGSSGAITGEAGTGAVSVAGTVVSTS